MISDYYLKQQQQQKQNTKTIKLKTNQTHLQPFIIPKSHFQPNNQLYQNLKEKCEKIKSEFTFIKSQIQREHKRKKQKHQRSLMTAQHTDSIKDQQNRDDVQKQVSVMCKKLLKLQQQRKSVLGFQHQEVRSKSTKRANASTQSQRIQSLMGKSVTFSPRNLSSGKLSSRNLNKTASQSRFSLCKR